MENYFTNIRIERFTISPTARKLGTLVIHKHNSRVKTKRKYRVYRTHRKWEMAINIDIPIYSGEEVNNIEF